MKQRDWESLSHAFRKNICDIASVDSERVLERALERCGPLADLTLVDLGCGVGTFIQRFGARFQHVIGVDFSRPALEQAQRRCSKIPGIVWLRSDIPHAARRLAGKGDVVVCLNVITSRTARARDRLWSGLAKVTKPGGHVIVVVPSLESFLYVRQIEEGDDYVAPSLRHGVVNRDGHVQKFFGKRELGNELKRHGFQKTRVMRIHYPWTDEALPQSLTRGKPRPWDWIAVATKGPILASNVAEA